MTTWEAPNMLWESYGQAHSGPWEATPEQGLHHDAAMPGADDGSAVPDANPWADVLTQPWSVPVPMEMPDACGWGQHPGPQGAAPAPMTP